MSQPGIGSPLWYGRKDVFERRLQEGYTEAAFGGGEWIHGKRVVRLWVFYHPDGRIATYEHPKFDFGHTVHGEPYEAEYGKREFQLHVKKFQIQLGKKEGLAGILALWKE